MTSPRRTSPRVAAVFAWLFATVLCAPVIVFLVLVLAGPHGGALPASLAPAVLIAGWVILLGLPILVARRVYLRMSREPSLQPGSRVEPDPDP